MQNIRLQALALEIEKLAQPLLDLKEFLFKTTIGDSSDEVDPIYPHVAAAALDGVAIQLTSLAEDLANE